MASTTLRLAICSGAVFGAWAALRGGADDAQGQGGYVTNVESTRAFKWTNTTRSAREAMELTFPRSAGWADGCFWEGGCADGRVMTQEVVASWVEDELLGGKDPFEDHVGKVPVPWPIEQYDTGDQLGNGQYVGYSRRQVCFIVAKALLGAGTEGYDNGLTRILATRVPDCAFPSPSVPRPEDVVPSALTGEFGISLWNLLSACAADPSLQDGRQGPLLLATKAKARPDVDVVREAAAGASLGGADLSACRYDDGGAGPVAGEGLKEMPASMCTPPTTGAPGRDFMTGGVTRVKGQAIQDISAKFLGGYVLGNACGLGGGQDERLMTYFPEVFALTFFLSQHWQYPQLRQPAWILGARMLHIGLDGTARFSYRLELDNAAPLVSDLMEVDVGDRRFKISGSTPFLAFMSDNQDFLDEEDCWADKPSCNETQEATSLARQNREPRQRAVDKGTSYSFMYQVRAWYSAVALTSYDEDVRPALRSVVKNLGTGPFLSGLWWGDSHMGFLTIWIGHAIAAPTWGEEGLPLQYYVYAAFTENPGNQCFVLPGEACKKCLGMCTGNPPPGPPNTAFWLPTWAYMGPEADKQCVYGSEEFCGKKGFKDVVAAYKGATALKLWEDVERKLESGPQTDSQVFDLLLA